MSTEVSFLTTKKIPVPVHIDFGSSDCPLCNLAAREPYNVLAEDEDCILIRTKYMKGHKERLMIVSKVHNSKFPWMHYINKWQKQIESAFSYTYKVVVLDGMFGSVPGHWHVVLTDIESDQMMEHYQMLGTPWLYIIQIKLWK